MAKIRLPRLRGVRVEDKMFLARYVGLMLRSGVSLTRGLELLAVQTSSPRLKEVLLGMAHDITGGMPVAESMEKSPDVFDELYVNMVRSGEVAGNLEEVFDILAEELRRSAEFRSKVVGAMIYPAIIILMMIVVSNFIVFFVFPKIVQVYASLNVQVPLLTRALIYTIKFVTGNIKYIAVGSALMLAGSAILVRTRPGKRSLDWLWLRFPVTKVLIRKVYTVQFVRTFSSLLSSGVTAPQALEITSRTFKSSYYRESLGALSTGIRQGKRLSDIMPQFGNLYPPIVEQMLHVGEETGQLATILKQLGDFFEQEISVTLDNLSKIIEPILMIALGIVVGFIAIATVQLIYSAVQSVT